MGCSLYISLPEADLIQVLLSLSALSQQSLALNTPTWLLFR